MITSATLLVFPALMSFAAMSDLVTMTIPNRVSLALVAAFIILALGLGMPFEALAWHVGLAFAILVATFGMFAAGWIGGGDAKLAAAIALWVGPTVLMNYFIYASVLGGALTIGIIYARGTPLPAFVIGWGWLARLHDTKTGIPYGIALAAAGLIVYPATDVWLRAFGG